MMQNKPLSQHPANQDKLHLYGNSAAVTFEATMKSDLQTVNVDIAPKPDQYNVDWSQKTTIQLSSTELVMVTGVFLGYAPEIHCGRPNKGIKFIRQPGKVYISASSQDKGMVGVPLTLGDCARAGEFFLYQLAKGSFSGDVGMVLASLKGALALNRLQN